MLYDHHPPPQQQQLLVSIGRSELKIEYQIWYYSISFGDRIWTFNSHLQTYLMSPSDRNIPQRDIENKQSIKPL